MTAPQIPEMAAGRPPPTSGRRLGAEAFGTFALVFVAAGADTMAVVSDGQVGVVARALAPALMVAALIYAIADASGAHFNPVVSLAFALRSLFPVSWLVPYWAAQRAGAMAAVLVIRALFGDQVAAGISTPHVAGPTALAIETILILILVTVTLGTADRARIVGPEAAIAVAATIMLCGLIALPIEGASMNPARSLAPAIVALRFDDVWIYLLGPVFGATLAVGATGLLHGAAPDERSAQAAQGE